MTFWMLRVCSVLVCSGLVAIVIGQAQFPLDWSQVTSSSSASDNPADGSFGTCVCDLTVARCDTSCCCDADCTAAEIALFRASPPGCLPSQFGPGPTQYCLDGSMLRGTNRIDATPVGSRVCVRVDNNPLLGRSLADPDVVTDSSAIGRLLEQAAAAEGAYSFAAASYATTSSSSATSYQLGQPIATVGGSGFFALPAAAIGISDRCVDSNPAPFLSTIVTGSCWRPLTSASDCLGPGFNPAVWLDGIRVARFPGDTAGVPLQTGTVTMDTSNRTVPAGQGSTTSGVTTSLATTGFATSGLDLTSGSGVGTGGNTSIGTPTGTSGALSTGTGILGTTDHASTGHATTDRPSTGIATTQVPSTGRATTAAQTTGAEGTTQTLPTGAPPTGLAPGTGAFITSDPSTGALSGQPTGGATSLGDASTGMLSATTGLAVPPPASPPAPNSTFDSTTNICHNAVVQVLVTFVHNGAGALTSATADFVVGSRAVAPVRQSFLQSFVRNDQTGGNPLHLRSGRPGYRVGEPVAVGFAVSGPSGQTGIAQSSDVDAGIYIPGTSRTGLCLSTGGPRITFGEDTVAGCTIPLPRSQLGGTGCLAVRAAINRIVTPGPWTHVGIFGDADYQRFGDWVAIDKAPLDLSGAVTGVDTGTTCRSVVREVHYDFIYAPVGFASNPQSKLIGATVRYVSGDVSQRCVGGNGLQCSGSNSTNATQPLELRVVVSFVPYPGQASETVVATPPPLIPPLPRDIFYPFLISSAVTGVPSWQGLMLALLVLSVVQCFV